MCFNEINGGKVKRLYHTYKEYQQTVIFIAINMRNMFIGKQM